MPRQRGGSARPGVRTDFLPTVPTGTPKGKDAP